MIICQRTCVACRRLIPESTTDLLSIVRLKAKWNKTKHKHLGKPEEGEHPVLCDTCAEKMLKLIESQIEKGVKVI